MFRTVGRSDRLARNSALSFDNSRPTDTALAGNRRVQRSTVGVTTVSTGSTLEGSATTGTTFAAPGISRGPGFTDASGATSSTLEQPPSTHSARTAGGSSSAGGGLGGVSSVTAGAAGENTGTA